MEVKKKILQVVYSLRGKRKLSVRFNLVGSGDYRWVMSVVLKERKD